MESWIWDFFSETLKLKIQNPRFGGFFTEEEVKEAQKVLIRGLEGSFEEGGFLCFYWKVDPEKKRVEDVRFQVFGPSLLVGAAEILSESVVQKNSSQISAFSFDHFLRALEIRKPLPEGEFFLDLAFSAMQRALFQLKNSSFVGGERNTFSDWKTLSKEEKLMRIEEVLDREVRPYVAMDQGGIRVLDLEGDHLLKIVYEGACATCHASGGTLQSIERVLRNFLDDEMVVLVEATQIFPGSDFF